MWIQLAGYWSNNNYILIPKESIFEAVILKAMLFFCSMEVKQDWSLDTFVSLTHLEKVTFKKSITKLSYPWHHDTDIKTD